MNDYTPTTSAIRGTYIRFDSGTSWESKQSRYDDFNRWLDQVRAEAWEEGRAAGWAEDCAYDAPNPYQQEKQDM